MLESKVRHIQMRLHDSVRGHEPAQCYNFLIIEPHAVENGTQMSSIARFGTCLAYVCIGQTAIGCHGRRIEGINSPGAIADFRYCLLSKLMFH